MDEENRMDPIDPEETAGTSELTEVSEEAAGASEGNEASGADPAQDRNQPERIPYECGMKPAPEKRQRNFRDGVLVGMLSMIGVACLVIMLSIVVSIGSGYSLGSSGVNTGSYGTAVSGSVDSKLAEIQAYIDKYFIFDVDDSSMVDSTAAGYMEGLNDPYSVYYTQEQYQSQMTSSNGSFVGIGAAVQQDPDTKTITAMTIYEGSPAEKGGMLSGDVVIAVNGEDITGMDLTDVVTMIRGEEGTEVTVTVRRGEEELDLTMTRATVNVQTVTYEMMEDQIGYIKLTEFDTVSIEQMKNAIEDLQSQGMKSLVLDLRDNPGGLLNSVVSITDFFLPETNIFYYQDKEGNRTDYDSTADQLCTEPMAILINGNSASASEVLSGSLQDHERATLVGTQSFGKGIVQSFFELSDGSAIKLTTAHYYTPNGNDIHGVGITPDIVVEDDPDTEEDEQLQAAVDALEQQ